jgi:DNA-binding beta-propeller fold protein YncE
VRESKFPVKSRNGLVLTSGALVAVIVASSALVVSADAFAPGNISIVRAINIGGIQGGAELGPIAYDSRTKMIFVAEVSNGTYPYPLTNISVISTETNQPVATIHLGVAYMNAIIGYDSVNSEIYVAATNITSQGNYSGTLYVLGDSTYKVLKTLTLGTTPNQQYYAISLAFDLSRNLLFISDDAGGTVTIFNANTNTVERVITIQPADSVGLSGIAYDPANRDIYVGGAFPGMIYIIDTTTWKLKDEISIFPEAVSLAYDQRNGEIYVVTYPPSLVVVKGDRILESNSHEFYKYDVAFNVIYDPHNSKIYAGGLLKLYEISGSTDKVVARLKYSDYYAVSMVYVAYKNVFYASDSANSVLIISPS